MAPWVRNLFLVLASVLVTGMVEAPAVSLNGPDNPRVFPAYQSSGVDYDDNITLIPPDQLRSLALHNAGFWSLPISTAGFPPWAAFIGVQDDPETGRPVGSAVFPRGTQNKYIFTGGIWFGGIVDGDTLVSCSYDVWWSGLMEFWPPDPEQGGVKRSGNFADDEFTAVFTDTVGEPYISWHNPYDDTTHIPLGIKMMQRSYSWRDSLYDNFVIFEFEIENIGDNYIEDGWFGVVLDPDIFGEDGPYSVNGWTDDGSGALDTLLYDGDSSSRVVIPYSFDLDGDPALEGGWDRTSVRGAVSIAALSLPAAEPQYNFNWWIAHTDPMRDFGPRRLGTPDDPFRPYAGGFLGTAHRQEDKYYQMAHPEIDYSQLEMEIHDSADGWVPIDRSIQDIINDTKMLFSMGSFDLAPGDTAVVAIALVASEIIHGEADGYADLFDPQNPQEYLATFDFGEMLTNHRRADSVYRSALTLPVPGPPVGLKAVEHNSREVHLSWHGSQNPILTGYRIYVMDTVYDDLWREIKSQPASDTTCIFAVSNPYHAHRFAVTTVDDRGRESAHSFELAVIPGRPQPPENVSVNLEGTVPVIEWMPPSDTGLLAYMIYRSEWRGPYLLYDSLSGLEYRDYEAESGVRYGYKITAVNDRQLESEASGPVSVIPMAMDRGVLFYDMNYDQSVAIDPYHRRYVDRMIDAVRPLTSMDYYDIEDGHLPFKEMSHYSVIVFDSEKRGGKIHVAAVDSIRNYLAGGGRVLFIIPNASVEDLGTMIPRTRRYSPGNFFNDYLKLDSIVSNAIVLVDDAIEGDLTGCRSLLAGYPELKADTLKIAASPVAIRGQIPMSGILYPGNDAENIYRYQSLYPDSSFHEQVNGIRYLGEDYRFVFFNFPLSVMEWPENLMAFRKALGDLGVDLSCGDINANNYLEIGDIVFLVSYLFRDGAPPDKMSAADVNCDGRIDLADVQKLINVVFLGGNGLSCCPP